MTSLRTMYTALLLLATIACIGVLPGCGSDANADIVGTYELDTDAVKAELAAAATESEEAAAKAEFASMLLDAMEMSITLKSDGTLDIRVRAMGDSDEQAGTWTRNGNELTITTAKEGDEPETGTVIIEGNNLRLMPDPGDDMPIEMIFQKMSS